VQEQEVQKAKKQVADRRADAAALLARTERARAQAAQAESAVAGIVQQMRQARIEAQLAVSKERQRLAELRQERNRVSQILAVRAARAARRHQAELTSFSGKSNGFLSYPVNGPVTSPYGMRMHPILHIFKLHDGTDCFHRGVSLSTAYNHLSSYRVDVGERVKRGEVLGYVGSTGYSTGCHLHFMVYENGVTVDPMSWL
jgi:murein DD-endopeptidase MepM/ murein hydrolase activator NlpD